MEFSFFWHLVCIEYRAQSILPAPSKRRSKMKKLVVMIVLLLATSCAAKYTANHDTQCRSMLGKELSELMLNYGTPAEIFNFPDGTNLYTFRTIKRRKNALTWPFPGPRQICETRFSVNAENKVIDYSFSGKGCQSYSSGGVK